MDSQKMDAIYINTLIKDWEGKKYYKIQLLTKSQDKEVIGEPLELSSFTYKGDLSEVKKLMTLDEVVATVILFKDFKTGMYRPLVTAITK